MIKLVRKTSQVPVVDKRDSWIVKGADYNVLVAKINEVIDESEDNTEDITTALLAIVQNQADISTLNGDVETINSVKKVVAHVTQTQEEVSSGELTPGTKYQIIDYQAGDDFTNLGASANENGATFIPGTISGTVENTVANVAAEKQVDTVTLTGTGGAAGITAAGGLSKTFHFDTSLTNTATNFVTDNAATYIEEGIVVTADGETLVFTAETSGVGFDSPVITNVPYDVSGDVVVTHENVEAVSQVDVVTLTGTSGTAGITGAGLELRVLSFVNSSSPSSSISPSDSESSSPSASESPSTSESASPSISVSSSESASPSVSGSSSPSVSESVSESSSPSASESPSGSESSSPSASESPSGSESASESTSESASESASPSTSISPSGSESSSPSASASPSGTSSSSPSSSVSPSTSPSTPTSALELTAAGFVDSYAADYLAVGVVLTAENEKLVFTASVPGTSFTTPEILNASGNLDGTVSNRTANRVAVKQVETVTLTGTIGYCDIINAGALTKRVTYDTDLETTASNFYTTNAADYLAKNIVLTVDGESLVFTAQTAGTGFTSPAISGYAGDMAGSVVNTNANVEAVAKVDTMTISGTSGISAVTVAGGLTKLITFDTDLETTAANFVTDHEADYLAQAILITSDGDEIIFTAETAGTTFDSPQVYAETAPAVWTNGTVLMYDYEPVATELYNTIGTTEWERTGVGVYTCTSDGAFPDGRTFIPMANKKSIDENSIMITLERTDDDTLTLKTYDTGVATDKLLSAYPIEVIIYPEVE